MYLSHVIGHVQVGMGVHALHQVYDVTSEVDILMDNGQMKRAAGRRSTGGFSTDPMQAGYTTAMLCLDPMPVA
jgi:hypothetical protein